MRRLLFFVLFFFSVGCVAGQNVVFQTEQLRLSVESSGFVASVKVCDHEILSGKDFPVAIACKDGGLVMPKSFEHSYGSLYELRFEDDGVALFDFRELDGYVKITLEHQESLGGYDALVIFPVAVTLADRIGEVVGVVQGRKLAFGMQALNAKTVSGVPLEYAALVQEKYGSKDAPTELSSVSLPAECHAAVRVKNGAMLRFSVKYRGREEKRTVLGVDGCMVLPVQDDDRLLEGASVAVFGCRQSEVLNVIGGIEEAEGLPHPMTEGQWNKRRRLSMSSYVVSDCSIADEDFVLEKCKLAGIGDLFLGETCYDIPDKVVEAMAEKARGKGCGLGVYASPNYIYSEKQYVAPVPSKHLLKQGVVRLQTDITADQSDFALFESGLFARPMTINVLQIGDELISYRTTELSGEIQILHSCERGAFGTKRSAHSSEETVYKLWDANQMLLPDMTLQDALAERFANRIADSQLGRVCFDGLEMCSCTGQDTYALARFLSRCVSERYSTVLVETSYPTHYNWHISARVNWREVWSEAVRVKMTESCEKRMDFLDRNLFPRMMGVFQLNLADRKSECTSLEEVEWAMSEAAGFDAGFGISLPVKTLQQHGQIDAMLAAVKNWDALRLADAFSEEQKRRLKDPYSEWHLEREDDTTFSLYEMQISRRVRCVVNSEYDASWQWDTPFGGAVAMRIFNEGKSDVENVSVLTEDGALLFPCRLKQGQCLVYGFDGDAFVADRNFNYLEAVRPTGSILVNEGNNTFSIECESNGKKAELTVRLMTRSVPEVIMLRKYE